MVRMLAEAFTDANKVDAHMTVTAVNMLLPALLNASSVVAGVQLPIISMPLRWELSTFAGMLNMRSINRYSLTR
jgi:hypothetical protein